MQYQNQSSKNLRHNSMNLHESEYNWEDRKSGRRWLKPALILLIFVFVVVALFASPIRKSSKLKGLWNSHTAADKRRGRFRYSSRPKPHFPRYSISEIKCGQKLQRGLRKYQTDYYRFKVPADAKAVVIRTCGSSFNTQLDLYKDRSIKNGWKRRCENCEFELDVVTYGAKADQLQAGKRYIVRVKDSRRAGGKYHIELECKKAAPICKTAECYKLSGLLLETMDLTANPCTDFVQYACGGWKEAELSALARHRRRTRLGEVQDLSTEAVLGELAYGTKFSSSQTLQKARSFYQSCLSAPAEQPRDIIEAIFSGSGLGFEAWQNGGQPSSWTENAIGDFQSKTAWLALRDWHPMINIDAYDLKALTLFAGRDFKSQDALQQLRYAGETYLSDKISNPTEVERIVENVTAFLKLLRALQMKIQFGSSTKFNFRRWGSIDSVELVDGAFNWTILDLPSIVMKMYGISSVENVTVQYMTKRIGTYFVDLEPLLEDTSPETVHYALTFSSITGWKQQIPIQTQKQDRVAFCFEQFKVQFPFMYGHMLALLKYPKSKLKLARKIIVDIRATIRRSIEKAVWLDELSRQRLLLKLDTMKMLVGYPDNLLKTDVVDAWYSGIQPMSLSFHLNIKITVEYGIHQEQQLFDGIPAEIVDPWPKAYFLDRSRYNRWLTDVNAFYVERMLFFAVPGSIQQRNVFDNGWPDYMNYGSIGTISGHEIGHAFSPYNLGYFLMRSGRAFWHSPVLMNSSRASYDELMRCFVDQYNSLKAEPGYNETQNGRFTLAENVADGIGLAAAYQAWARYSTRNELVPFFESMTPEKMFFVSYGNVWCSAWRPGYNAELARNRKDPHSVMSVRILGGIQNMAEFTTAFNCPVGVPSNPARSRCKVW